MTEYKDEKLNQLRHVISFFMEEAQTEARDRMSLESRNAELAAAMNRLGLHVNDVREHLNQMMGLHFVDWQPSQDTWHLEMVGRIGERLSAYDKLSHHVDKQDDLLSSISQQISKLWPGAARGGREDDVSMTLSFLKNLKALEEDWLKLKAQTCWSCKHEKKAHDNDAGCWFSVSSSKREHGIVCPCDVKFVDLEYPPKPEPDALAVAGDAMVSGIVARPGDTIYVKPGETVAVEHITFVGDDVPVMHMSNDQLHNHDEGDPCEVWCYARNGCGDPACNHAPDGGNHPKAVGL